MTLKLNLSGLLSFIQLSFIFSWLFYMSQRANFCIEITLEKINPVTVFFYIHELAFV